MVTTEQVKELREKTGISVMQCKRALEEAGGDMQKAVAILKKNSAGIAEKKAGRSAKDGAVAVKHGEKKATLVTLRCETDFVAQNSDFLSLLTRLAEIALKKGVEKMKEEAKEAIDPIIQKTGENIELGECYEVAGDTIGSYVHGNNKIGVIVSLLGGNMELARNIAMHTAAMKPEYLSEKDISEESRNMVREIFEKETVESGKPEEIKRKILEGKIAAYFKEKTLLEQAFIKDSSITVGALLDKNRAEIKEVKRSAI